MKRKRSAAIARYTIPVRLTNFANARLHWAARDRIIKKLRTVSAYYALVSTARTTRRLPATVTLTRLYPEKGRAKAMDSDGVVSAMKPIRDGIADAWGVDDKDGKWKWRYGQRTAQKYGVEVEIET